MAIAAFLESYLFDPSGFWTTAPLRYAAKFDPFLSLDCAPTPSTLAQSKERKGSNFAIWQPWFQASPESSDEYKFAKECVEGMVWLDCGHSGSGKKTYVNDSEVLERLVQLDIKVDVRATPYQGLNSVETFWLEKWLELLSDSVTCF